MMNRTFVGAWIVPLLVGSAFAHPHFSKETIFRWDREDSPDARKVTVSHITVPYNEMKAGELPVGESWHLGFAKLKTTLDLESGDTKIAAGEYELKGIREAEDRWSLQLVSGKGDDQKITSPKCEFKADLPVVHHLLIETHPDGEKEDTTVWVSVRFGDMQVRLPIAPN